jgi:putative phosphoesterase
MADMKILVLSDSHRSLKFMRRCVDAIRPDAIVHLGDYYDDADLLHEEYPRIPMYQVSGNCDIYRCPPFARDILIMPVCGVSLYMTHGHRHNVKMYLDMLLRDARASNVQAVLYGHTHIPNCYQDKDGMWVLNPGSCGTYCPSAGLIEVEDGKIISCTHVTQEDLEGK